jgi:hypothetical protein
MGMPSAVVQPGTQPQGKGFATPNPQSTGMPDQAALTQQAQPMGKGGRVTYPSTNGQPQMGQPNTNSGMDQQMGNMYPNTVGQWDNASIQPQQSRNRGGKGKG